MKTQLVQTRVLLKPALLLEVCWLGGLLPLVSQLVATLLTQNGVVYLLVLLLTKCQEYACFEEQSALCLHEVEVS